MSKLKPNKRMKSAYEGLDQTKVYSLSDAFDQIEKFPKVKFDETIELHLHLDIDVKANDQMVRGTVALPHGSGKDVRVAAFCKGELADKAKEAGADHVGDKELIDKVTGGFLDFDVVVASPDMMRDLSKLGKVLGPRGLMPTPKAGTVTQDVAKAIKEVKAGKIEFKADKQAGLHVGVGKRSFSKDKILENATKVIDAIHAVKPTAVKGHLVKSMYVTTTMGPGVKVEA